MDGVLVALLEVGSEPVDVGARAPVFDQDGAAGFGVADLVVQQL